MAGLSMLNSANESILSISHLLGFMGLPMGMEWVVLLVLGLLIFGRRLPEVGRSLGRGIVEFKKGIRGIEEDIDEESSRSNANGSKRIAETAPRSELPRTASSETIAAEDRRTEG